MIALEKLTKSFGREVAVDHIDLFVPAGSIFGLIGPNGAGKTTTLRMISTLSKPDSGSIRVCGFQLPGQVRDARRVLGYMPDDFGTFRGVNCEEYLIFFGRAYGYQGATLAARIRSVLEITDLEHIRDKLTSALSAGMRQRLSLAKTLLHDPQVLILDEPASGLDPRARIEIRALLRELSKMGKTVLISSHILADLDEICSDVAIIEAGTLIWSGSLAQVRQELRQERFDATLVVPEEDVERAVDVLNALEEVRDAEPVDGRIQVKMIGRHGNRILEALIRESIEIRSFSEARVHLEEIFLERTRGIVA